MNKYSVYATYQDGHYRHVKIEIDNLDINKLRDYLIETTPHLDKLCVVDEETKEVTNWFRDWEQGELVIEDEQEEE